MIAISVYIKLIVGKNGVKVIVVGLFLGKSEMFLSWWFF